MTADTSPEPDDDPGAIGAQLVVEKHLTQGFRMASPIQRLLGSTKNADGDVEYFMLGADGVIWNVFPDPTSDTGFSAVTTNVPRLADFAFGLTGAGSMLAISTNSGNSGDENNEVTSSMRDPGRPWSAATSETVPCPHHWYTDVRNYVARLQTYRCDDGCLFVIAICPHTTQPGCQVWYKAMLGGSLDNERFNNDPVAGGPFEPYTLQIAPNLWIMGRDAATAGVITLCDVPTQALFLGGGALGVNIPQFVPEGEPQASTFSYDADGMLRAFYTMADGNIYTVAAVADGDTLAAPVPLSTDGQFRSMPMLQAVVDGTGTTHLFARSLAPDLYHWTSEAGSEFSSPSVLLENCADFFVAVNGAGTVDVAVQTNSPVQFVRLTQQEARHDAGGNVDGPGDWEQSTIELDSSNDTLETLDVYSTEVWVTDANGAPVVDQTVSITAHDVTLVMVNGVEHLMLPTRAVEVATNAAGMFTLVQPTTQLGAVSFDFTIIGVTTNGPVVVDPGADVQVRLNEVATNTEAQDALKQSVPQIAALSPESFSSFVSGIGDVLSISPDASSVRSLSTRRGPRSGVHLRTGGQAGSRIGLGSIPAAGFKLAFGADSVHHEPIAEHDAANIRAAWLADGAQPWVGSFSDLAQALAVGAAADESPTAVGPATFLVTPGASDATGSHWWSVAVNFVMDGISWLADLVIECLADALDAVMSFFAAVGAFFKDLFAFLGYLFDWPDILRTADAVSYGITQVLELVSSAVAGLQGQVAGGIASAKTNVAEWFAGLQAKAQSMGSIAAVGNQGERADAASTSPVLSGVSNNVLMNALMDHGAAAQPVSISSFSLDDDDPSAMFVALSTAEGQDPNALVSLTAGLQGHMAGPAGLDKFVQTSVSTILQLIEQAVQAILDGAQAVADALFNIIQWAVKQTNDFLTAPLEIPLLTNLYTTVVNPGQPLTIAGLSSIIVAVPATVIYKLVAGSAPFPTDGDVNSFKTNYTVSAMQKSSGLTPSGAPTLGRLGARPGLVESDAPPVPTQTYVPVRSEAQLLAGIISGVSSLVGGVLAAISDTELPLVASSPPADAPSSPLASFYKVVGTIAVACDVSAAAFSLPGVWDADGGSPEPAEVILWTYSAVGTVVDLGMLVASGSRRARGNAFRDGVAVAWTMYGGIHCLLVGIVALTADDLGWTWLPDMLAGVAEVTQVGLTSTFMGETGDLSAVVTVAAQVFASVGGGIITIGDAVASYKK